MIVVVDVVNPVHTGKIESLGIMTVTRIMPKEHQVGRVKLRRSFGSTILLDWVMSLERDFNWYEMSQERRIHFAAMKLVGHAGYYWSNVERLMAIRRQEPVRTWEEMRAKLNQKYIPIAFQDQQLDKWSRLNQGNQFAAEFIETFDEF